MPRLSLTVRVLAGALAMLLSLTGPGAALAHGMAHVREHRAASRHEADEHHAPHLLDRLAALVHGHEHEHEHDDEGVTGPAPDAESHGHPRLDAQAISRVALGAPFPTLVTPVLVAPVIVATMPAPPAASP